MFNNIALTLAAPRLTASPPTHLEIAHPQLPQHRQRHCPAHRVLLLGGIHMHSRCYLFHCSFLCLSLCRHASRARCSHVTILEHDLLEHPPHAHRVPHCDIFVFFGGKRVQNRKFACSEAVRAWHWGMYGGTAARRATLQHQGHPPMRYGAPIRSISMVFLYTANCMQHRLRQLKPQNAHAGVSSHSARSQELINRRCGRGMQPLGSSLTSPSCSTYKQSAGAPCGYRSWPGAVGTGLNMAATCMQRRRQFYGSVTAAQPTCLLRAVLTAWHRDCSQHEPYTVDVTPSACSFILISSSRCALSFTRRRESLSRLPKAFDSLSMSSVRNVAT